MTFQEQYNRYLAHFEDALKKTCGRLQTQPPVLGESMCYSLFSGGKRIRPVLFYATLDCLGRDWREDLLAVALESIHTYSLIHDDLPAMDNDDFRRGKPSNHKAFGEANAILAGDSLLSFACSLLLEVSAQGERYLQAARFLMDAAGTEGMLAGQSADLLYENQDCGADILRFIYEHKTGKLLIAPVAMAAILAGADLRAAVSFGSAMGELFQLTDDILDVKGNSGKMGKTLGKDRTEGKLTCVKVFGLEGSEKLADHTAERCLETLRVFCADSEFLRDLVHLVRKRDN